MEKTDRLLITAIVELYRLMAVAMYHHGLVEQTTCNDAIRIYEKIMKEVYDEREQT